MNNPRNSQRFIYKRQAIRQGTRAMKGGGECRGIPGIVLGIIAQAALDWWRKPEYRMELALYFSGPWYAKHCEIVGVCPELLPQGITWDDIKNHTLDKGD